MGAGVEEAVAMADPDERGPGRVVVLGSLSQDLHLDVARHPRSGETVMAGDLTYRFGGKGANQAVAAARAGAQTMIIGRLGDDTPGRDYRDRLARYGVDTAGLVLDPGSPTGTAIIAVDADGENLIMVAPGANHRLAVSDLVALDELTDRDVLVMPLESPVPVVIEAVRRAFSRGARVVLNLAPYAELPPEVLEACDPVVVNEHEHDLLESDGLDPSRLLVTLGTGGSRWGDVTVAAVNADVVDTTGAGDAYVGTLAARLAAGDDRRSAMTAASAAAAVTVGHHGAQPPLPDAG